MNIQTMIMEWILHQTVYVEKEMSVKNWLEESHEEITNNCSLRKAILAYENTEI